MVPVLSCMSTDVVAIHEIVLFFSPNCLFSSFLRVSLEISSSASRWMLVFIVQSDLSLYVFPCQANLLMPSESARYYRNIIDETMG